MKNARLQLESLEDAMQYDLSGAKVEGQSEFAVCISRRVADKQP
jgi:hypothetical protein